MIPYLLTLLTTSAAETISEYFTKPFDLLLIEQIKRSSIKVYSLQLGKKEIIFKGSI